MTDPGGGLRVLARSRRLGLLLLVLLSAWLVSQTTFHGGIDTWLRDKQQAITAQEHYFPGSLVVDIDDVSLKILEPLVGTWPYSRDVYARVYAYLLEQGAQQVVFDLLFAEARPGDQQLREVQQPHFPAIYVAVASSRHIPLDEQERERLNRLGWPVTGDPPAPTIESLILPRIELTNNAEERIGLVTATSDADGILRRLPLLYHLDGVYLPSLPLRTLLDAPRPQVTLDNRHLQVHGYRIPVDEKGQTPLYFPRNPNAILTIPFFELVEAAYGLRQVTNPQALLQGKTLFIGSTAYLSDRVNTPRGAMSGTYLLALAHETLANGLSLQPDRRAINAALLLIALLPGLVYGLRQDGGLLITLALPAALGVLLVGINLALLAGLRQSSDLLSPLILLVITSLLTSLHLQLQVKRYNRTLQSQNQQLSSAANSDTLTGLANRRAFLHAFDQELERIRRFGGALPTLAIMDLDHFKNVNDTYGHDLGDQVLILFAEVLTASVRSGDVPARWGGEEFVVLLPQTSTEAAMTVLERVRTGISSSRIPPPAQDLVVTVSIGLAAVADSDSGADEGLKRADLALYGAKETGRNRICVEKPPNPAANRIG